MSLSEEDKQEASEGDRVRKTHFMTDVTALTTSIEKLKATLPLDYFVKSVAILLQYRKNYF